MQITESSLLKLMDRVEDMTRKFTGAYVTSDWEASEMKELRLRVRIGNDEDGRPIFRRVGAYDEITLADRVAQALVDSGRIYEFLPLKQAQEPSVVPETPTLHPFDALSPAGGRPSSRAWRPLRMSSTPRR